MTITGAALFELLSRGPTFVLRRLARLPPADSCRTDSKYIYIRYLLEYYTLIVQFFCDGSILLLVTSTSLLVLLRSNILPSLKLV
jgi:hypothetical protein